VRIESRIAWLLATLLITVSGNAAPAAAEIKSTAIRLLQPTNAQRLEQLQSILRERGLTFELQTVPNPIL
jgi:hypothetical protein